MPSTDLIFSLNNPIILSVLLSLALLGLTYIFYVHIFVPSNKKFKEEKESLETRNEKLMALFAQLDPEPLFRFDKQGRIILANKAAIDLLKDKWRYGIKIIEFLPSLNKLDFAGIIDGERTINLSAEILGEYFDITIKGISEMGFGQIYCNNITTRKIAASQLSESRKKLRELSNHLQKLQEEEKQKISMELHDSLGQILTSIKINLELLKGTSTNTNIVNEQVDEITLLIENAMSEVRDISHRLKPRILDDLGLIPALNSLCNEVSKKANIKGIFQAHKLKERLNSEVETTLYRVAQEALNNIVKHAQANEFNIQLVKHPGFIRMMVEDDGVGFDTYNKQKDHSKKSGMGLINMSERTLAINGKLVIDSRKGAGTEIIVEIPMENINEQN